MIEKYRVYGLTDKIIAPKREGDIAEAARSTDTGKMFMYPLDGLNKVNRIVVMLFDTGANGKDVGIENNISRINICLFDKNIEAAFTDIDLYVP